MTPSSGSIYTGSQVRTRQSPFYDSFTVATSTTLTSTGQVKMFGNIDGVSGIGPDTTNMQKAYELPGGTSILVRALRIVIAAAAADIASFNRLFTIRLIAGGIKLLDAPAEFWAGGAGCQAQPANGMPDPRAVCPFDLDPIDITDGISFYVLCIGTTFTTTAQFFLRAYLDGRITEPV